MLKYVDKQVHSTIQYLARNRLRIRRELKDAELKNGKELNNK